VRTQTKKNYFYLKKPSAPEREASPKSFPWEPKEKRNFPDGKGGETCVASREGSSLIQRVVAGKGGLNEKDPKVDSLRGKVGNCLNIEGRKAFQVMEGVLKKKTVHLPETHQIKGIRGGGRRLPTRV